MQGKPVLDDKLYTIGMQEFHYNSLKDFFNITYEEIEANGKVSVLTTSDAQTLLEYFEDNKHLGFNLANILIVE